MSQVGRISGPLLAANLERKGTIQPASQANLSFRNDNDSNVLLKINVNDGRIGVDVDSPVNELQVSDTLRTIDLIGDAASVANFTISNNNIVVNSSDIYLNAGEHIQLSNLETEQFYVSDNYIETTKTNRNIELRPSGTGTVEVQSNLNVFGNLHAIDTGSGTGNITLGGNIVFGDAGQAGNDTVDFEADIDTSIVPDLDNVYKLGSLTKQWKTLHTELVNGQLITSGLVNVSGILLESRPGNIWYVAANGSNTNVGDHVQGPLATIEEAISRCEASTNAPTVIYVFPGTYEENLPLILPPNVSIIGHNIRNTVIVPAAGSENKDVFHLNDSCTVSDLTIKNFNYDSVNNTGYAFRFASGAVITGRSPYIQNVTVKTEEVPGITGSITIGPDITLFSQTSNSVNLSKATWSQELVESLVGQTAVIDRYPNPPLIYTVVSIETDPVITTQWRMTVDSTFNPAGQIKNISFYPDAGAIELITNDIWDTTGNSIGEKWVAWFKTNLPVNFETTVQPGWTINVAGTLYVVDYVIQDPVNSNMWRIYVTTSLVGGVGIPIFSSPITSASTPAGKGAWIDGSELNSASIEASMLFHSATFITPGVDAITMTNGVRVEWLNSFTYFANRGLYAVRGLTGRTSYDGSTVNYGAEVRSIGSANVYGNYGAVADGADTLMYLIQHNFGYIGSGNYSDNDPSRAIIANETVELNTGKIHYVTTDHLGTFRIGDNFFVDFETGTTSINVNTLSVNQLTELVINTGNNTTVIDGAYIETGNLRISDNIIESLGGDLNIASATGKINLQDNTNIVGNLDITGNLSFGGTLSISGNEATDSLKFNVELEQDFNPNQTLKFNLGSFQKQWLLAHLDRIESGDFSIYDNVIETNVSNADLELRANGTGNVYIPDSATISNALTVSGLSSFNNNVSITGTLNYAGNLTQTGSQTVSGNLDIGQKLDVGAAAQFEEILVDDNFITTTTPNTDLDLRASGSGIVNIQTTLEVVNNLSADNISVQSNVTSTLNTTVDNANISNIQINDNYVQTTTANGDLTLLADRDVVVTGTNTTLDQTLTVLGATDLQNTNITGELTHIGDTLQTGNVILSGDLTNGNIRVNDNTISTTLTDSSLVLIATKDVTAPSSDVEIVNDLTVQGSTSLQGTNITGTLTRTGNTTQTGNYTIGGEVTVDSVYIEDNFITTTGADQNLELRATSGEAVLIPTNDVIISNNLTVNAVTTLNDTAITGTLAQIGDRSQIGNYAQTGNLITSTVDLQGDVQFTDVKIYDNIVTTTVGNNDLDLRASGTGDVIVDGTNMRVNNDLFVANITTGNITIQQDLVLDEIEIPPSIIQINDNYITTKTSNADLDLRATGNVTVPFNSVIMDQDLTVNGTTDLKNTNILGTVNLIGDRTQHGNYNLTGQLSIGSLSTDRSFQFDNVRISGNVLETTLSNSNLELRANGSGIIRFDDNVRINNNLTTNQLSIPSIFVNRDVALETIELSTDVQFFDNVITTTNSNSDLELRANGTGSVFIETLEFDTGIIKTAGSDITLKPLQNLTIDSTAALLLPSGTTAQQKNAVGDIRFNTANNTFDGTTASSRVIFGGVYSQNRLTSVLAHPTDNTVGFRVNGTTVGTVAAAGLTIHTLQVDDIFVNNNSIVTNTSNSDLELVTNGTGNLIIDNISIEGNVIKDSGSNLVIRHTGFGKAKIGGTGAVVIPSGTTAERPAPENPPQIGDTRWNTDTVILEVWDGTQYISAAGTASAITPQQFDDLLFEYTVIFG